MKRPVSRLLALLGATLLAIYACSCRKAPPAPLVARAEFGVFFGGQVQEREAIPFQLDRSKLSFGFRIDFSEPLERPVKVAWELERPAIGRAARRPDDRIAELSEASARIGQKRFDQVLAFQPGDPLGTWTIRIDVDSARVVDRSFRVYDPHVRPSDAGAH